MVLVVIRTVLRPDADVAAYEALAVRMDALVRTIPGFVSAEDAGELSLVRFASLEALAAWRNHPEHLEAQRAGRERFYRAYRVEVYEQVRAYDGPAGRG